MFSRWTERHTKRLREAEERLDSAEGALAKLRREWAEWQDMNERLMRRVLQRARSSQQSAEPTGSEQAQDGNDTGGGASNLFPGLDPVSERILRRRAMRMKGVDQ